MSVTGDAPEPGQGRAYGVPARRRRIIEILTDAYARDDLEQSEFERRIETAEHARTVEELDQLIADFPAEVIRSAPAPSHSGVPAVLTSAELQREISRLEGTSGPTRLNVLGDQHISVSSGDPRVISSVSVIGDCVIDLRELSGEGGVFLVKVTALLGDTKIIVPRGTTVDVRLLSLIGDQKRTRLGGGLLKRLARKFGVAPVSDEPATGLPGPTVVVTGFRVIGDTEIIEE